MLEDNITRIKETTKSILSVLSREQKKKVKDLEKIQVYERVDLYIKQGLEMSKLE